MKIRILILSQPPSGHIMRIFFTLLLVTSFFHLGNTQAALPTEPLRLVVIGTGYVGLVTGTCFAELGHQVTCLDIDADKIARLHEGEIPFFEPGLEELVKKNVTAGRLLFSTDYAASVPSAEVCFIAVPTPSKENGGCDTRYIMSVAEKITYYMSDGVLVINKSTAPPGTAFTIQEKIEKSLQEQGRVVTFQIASNPEFLKEGSAVKDCLYPDRVILGGNTAEALETMKRLYAGLNLREEQIITMDLLSAEMTKYAANAMLASRISFMNELAGLCERWGASIENVRIGIGADPRIGSQFLCAGIGYGGSCFPKDVRALKMMGEETGYPTLMCEAIDAVNANQKRLLGEKIKNHYTALKDKKIAIWGLAFKPNTDDMREAPSLDLIRYLLQEGAYLRLYDPIAMDNAKKLLPDSPQIVWSDSPLEAAEGADGIALVTEWAEFRTVDLNLLLTRMHGKSFFDGRNQYHPEEMRLKGFEYFGIGFPPPRP